MPPHSPTLVAGVVADGRVGEPSVARDGHERGQKGDHRPVDRRQTVASNERRENVLNVVTVANAVSVDIDERVELAVVVRVDRVTAVGYPSPFTSTGTNWSGLPSRSRSGHQTGCSAVPTFTIGSGLPRPLMSVASGTPSPLVSKTRASEGSITSSLPSPSQSSPGSSLPLWFLSSMRGPARCRTSRIR